MANASYVVPNPAFQLEYARSPDCAKLLGAATGVVAGRAQQLAEAEAFETGRYAESIHGVVGMLGFWVGRVLSDVPYAGYVEVGTEDTPARHILTRSAQEVGLVLTRTAR